MTEAPLIYTTRGNVPIADLTYATRWEVTGDYTKLIETYHLGGELVRESAHVLAHTGLTAESITPTFA